MNVGDTIQKSMDYVLERLCKRFWKPMKMTSLFVPRKERIISIIFDGYSRVFVGMIFHWFLKRKKFGVVEGKLLYHIICKGGVKVDPKRHRGIKEIGFPRNLKTLQSFFQKINFIHGINMNFVEITKPLNKLLNKDVCRFHIGKWFQEHFQRSQGCYRASDGLVSHDYSNPFQIFNFEYANTIAGFLLQKNDQNEECPIAFMR